MRIKFTDKATLLKVVPLLIAVFIVLIQIITLVSTIKILRKTEKEEISQAVFAVDKPIISQDALYCLYECGGKIGIYDAKSQILVDIINVFAASLPQSDQILLKNGIEIFSFTELSNIIDDFTS